MHPEGSKSQLSQGCEGWAEALIMGIGPATDRLSHRPPTGPKVRAAPTRAPGSLSLFWSLRFLWSLAPPSVSLVSQFIYVSQVSPVSPPPTPSLCSLKERDEERREKPEETKTETRNEEEKPKETGRNRERPKETRTTVS
jgi:hypothetical protein